MTDYIIGSPDSLLHEDSDFFLLVEQSNQTPLRLFVYNVETDRCREICITPNDAWGGEGR